MPSNWMTEAKGAKGQLILEWLFGVIKATKFLTDFCPSFIGQKSVLNLVGFLRDLKTPKFYSEINRPLWSTLFK